MKLRFDFQASSLAHHARGAGPRDQNGNGFSEAIQAARSADTVILVVGEDGAMSGEASSRSSLDLPGVQEQLAEAVYAIGKPVVAVLMNGRPLAVTWLDAHVPSILETWFLVVGQSPIPLQHTESARPPMRSSRTSRGVGPRGRRGVPSTPRTVGWTVLTLPSPCW